MRCWGELKSLRAQSVGEVSEGLSGIEHIFLGNTFEIPKSSPTNQFNRSLISLNSAKKKNPFLKKFWRFHLVVK